MCLKTVSSPKNTFRLPADSRGTPCVVLSKVCGQLLVSFTSSVLFCHTWLCCVDTLLLLPACVLLCVCVCAWILIVFRSEDFFCFLFRLYEWLPCKPPTVKWQARANKYSGRYLISENRVALFVVSVWLAPLLEFSFPGVSFSCVCVRVRESKSACYLCAVCYHHKRGLLRVLPTHSYMHSLFCSILLLFSSFCALLLPSCFSSLLLYLCQRLCFSFTVLASLPLFCA